MGGTLSSTLFPFSLQSDVAASTLSSSVAVCACGKSVLPIPQLAVCACGKSVLPIPQLAVCACGKSVLPIPQLAVCACGEEGRTALVSPRIASYNQP